MADIWSEYWWAILLIGFALAGGISWARPGTRKRTKAASGDDGGVTLTVGSTGGPRTVKDQPDASDGSDGSGGGDGGGGGGD
ncbi:hypothetical protein ACWCOP_02070 [Maricaulaceae bacterium MS644]